jgi:hypothetical protein
MTPPRSESTVPAGNRPQTPALDRSATGIGKLFSYGTILWHSQMHGTDSGPSGTSGIQPWILLV